MAVGAGRKSLQKVKLYILLRKRTFNFTATELFNFIHLSKYIWRILPNILRNARINTTQYLKFCNFRYFGTKFLCSRIDLPNVVAIAHNVAGGAIPLSYFKTMQSSN